jgi:hypothetical protein
MSLPRRRFLHLVSGAVVLPAVSRIARAQAYPTRPITPPVRFDRVSKRAERPMAEVA